MNIISSPVLWRLIIIALIIYTMIRQERAFNKLKKTIEDRDRLIAHKSETIAKVALGLKEEE